MRASEEKDARKQLNSSLAKKNPVPIQRERGKEEQGTGQHLYPKRIYLYVKG